MTKNISQGVFKSKFGVHVSCIDKSQITEVKIFDFGVGEGTEEQGDLIRADTMI